MASTLILPIKKAWPQWPARCATWALRNALHTSRPSSGYPFCFRAVAGRSGLGQACGDDSCANRFIRLPAGRQNDRCTRSCACAAPARPPGYGLITRLGELAGRGSEAAITTNTFFDLTRTSVLVEK